MARQIDALSICKQLTHQIRGYSYHIQINPFSVPLFDFLTHALIIENTSWLCEDLLDKTFQAPHIPYFSKTEIQTVYIHLPLHHLVQCPYNLPEK